MKRPPLVEVNWKDAWSSEAIGDMTPEAMLEKHGALVNRYTVGYFIGEVDDVIMLVRTVDPPDDKDEKMEVSGPIVIPKGWVTNLRYIERRRVNRGEKVKPEGVAGVSTDTPPSS